ncbi:MAG: hypothetical protein Q4F67_14730 [Propionibacteriaceae bacterium]|nr:hypothetical protein [Propionibacteriaceae bacterium]
MHRSDDPPPAFLAIRTVTPPGVSLGPFGAVVADRDGRAHTLVIADPALPDIECGRLMQLAAHRIGPQWSRGRLFVRLAILSRARRDELARATRTICDQPDLDELLDLLAQAHMASHDDAGAQRWSDIIDALWSAADPQNPDPDVARTVNHLTGRQSPTGEQRDRATQGEPHA